MTISDLLTAVRRRYNAVGDSFWSDDELLGLVHEACLELNREAYLIEAVYSTTTVASQQEYTYPTNTIAIKRIQYDGKKLKPITFRQDDAITGLDQDTTSTGTPQYYMVWNETIYLRPIPTGAATLKIWSINEPQQLTITSSLEIPSEYHLDLIKYCVGHMAAKDSNLQLAQFYLMQWESAKQNAKKNAKKRLRSDSFNTVQEEEGLIETYLGVT